MYRDRMPVSLLFRGYNDARGAYFRDERASLTAEFIAHLLPPTRADVPGCRLASRELPYMQALPNDGARDPSGELSVST